MNITQASDHVKLCYKFNTNFIKTLISVMNKDNKRISQNIEMLNV